jgi:2-polyprenyl-3-methyl-5-hydroxy-6-metoxy-1,4-benzoquinol methylase
MKLAHIPIVIKQRVRHLFGYKVGYHKDNKQPYYAIPEMNIKGRRPGTDIATRLQGLSALLDAVRTERLTSVLDAGCAEGLIAQEFHAAGATTIHGFDLQDVSITLAKQIFDEKDGTIFFGQADLLDWNTFTSTYQDVLRKSYDIVLLLSVYNHIVRINEDAANHVLEHLAARTKHYFVVRSSAPIPNHLIEQQGFQLQKRTRLQKETNLSIFRRVA